MGKLENAINMGFLLEIYCITGPIQTSLLLILYSKSLPGSSAAVQQRLELHMVLIVEGHTVLSFQSPPPSPLAGTHQHTYHCGVRAT